MTIEQHTPRRLPELEQGTLEWHEHREQYRNASEAAAVMGLSPWVSPLMLYRQKKGLAVQETNWAMQHGKDHESEARAAFARHTDVEPAVFTRGPYSASLDGYSERAKVLVEIKCPVGKDSLADLKEAARTGNVPEHYRVQIEQQLRCAGCAAGYLFVWDAAAKEGICSPEILPDDKLWAKIEKAWEGFAKALTDDKPPKLSELDTEERKDEEFLNLSKAFLEKKATIEALQAEQEAIREQIKKLCRHIKTTGGGLIVSQTFQKGQVAYSQIPFLKSIDLDRYRKETQEVWRIMEAKQAEGGIEHATT